MDQGPASLLNDSPADRDYLGFTPYRRALSGLITDPHADNTPLTIGVFGLWGTGKTTLLKMVREDVDATPAQVTDSGVQRKHITVWFTAWKYDKPDALWRALLLRVVAAVRANLEERAGEEALEESVAADLDRLEDRLYYAIDRVEYGRVNPDWLGLGAGLAQTAIQGLLASIPGLNLFSGVVAALGEDAAKGGAKRTLDALKRETKKVHEAQVKSLEQFQDAFARLIAKYLGDRRLVVFVDDLDRCLPEKAVDVLEAIKLFLDVRGCVFVLGMARKVITRAIKIKYGKLGEMIDGERYLEKIVQVPFDLPPLEVESVTDYVQKLQPRLTESCREVFATGLGEPNPRRIKRMLNSYLFLLRLAAEIQKHDPDRLGTLNDVRLAKIVAIQHGDPALYGLLRIEPRFLRLLEEHYRRWGERPEPPVQGDTHVADDLPESLKAYAGNQPLSRLLLLCQDDQGTCFAGLDRSEIRPYFSLARSVTMPEEERASRVAIQPELVPVPDGEFLMGTSEEEIDWLRANTDWAKDLGQQDFSAEMPQHSVHLSAYQIGRYPVTNVEYRAFVQATGQVPPSHWQGVEPPEEINDHPVVSVSHDDVLAYCTWLSEQTGKSYRLPTEAEWEKAARGTDARQYPWGNTFDSDMCNTGASGPGSTTPVTQYMPAGASPYGCADMAGNVWEWCLDWYAEEYYQQSPRTNPSGPARGSWRVVRGGSWADDRRGARCACRGSADPYDRSDGVGFRVVVALPISAGSVASGF